MLYFKKKQGRKNEFSKPQKTIKKYFLTVGCISVLFCMIDGIFDDPFFFQFQPQNYVSFLDLILLPAVHQTLICTARWLLFSVDMITFLFVILGSFSLPFFLVLNLHRNALKSSSISSIFIATFRTKIVQVDFA